MPKAKRRVTKKSRRKNYDPSRTLSLRQAFVKEIRKRFRVLKGRLYKLIVVDDAFGLAKRGPFTVNQDGCGPDQLIEVPNVRQPNDYFCGASATNGVAQLRGLQPGSLLRTAGELGTTVERSTHPSAVVGYFQQRGCQVEARAGLTIDDLKRYHALGWPVIVCLQDYVDSRDPQAQFDYGHYLTVIGVGFGYVFCQDSSMENWEDIHGGSVKKGRRDTNLDAPGRVMIYQDDFMNAWHDKDVEGNKYIRWGCAVGPAMTTVQNAFCPTGVGGGVDPSCSTQGSSGKSHGIRVEVHRVGQVISQRIDRIPGGKRLREFAGKLKQKLIDRYGAKNAALIVASGQAISWGAFGAGIALGTPIWIPSAAAMTPALVIAELHHQLRTKTTTNEEELTQEQIRKLAEWFIRQLEEAWRKIRPTTNADFSFHSSPEQLKKFQEWIRQQYASLLTGKTEEELWQIYTEQGFKRGAGRAFDDTNAGYYAAQGATADEGGLDFMAGGRDQFLRSAFGRPETVEKIQLLASRSFTDLKNVTEDMATKMGRILVDGLVTGSHPREMADQMDDVLDIGLQRADIIARTEIIRAHAEGQLDAFDRLGVTQIGVEVEWSIAGDDRVCPECEDMDGKIFSVEDAHGMIPLHPQCRCAFIPHIPEELTKNQRSRSYDSH